MYLSLVETNGITDKIVITVDHFFLSIYKKLNHIKDFYITLKLEEKERDAFLFTK